MYCERLLDYLDVEGFVLLTGSPRSRFLRLFSCAIASIFTVPSSNFSRVTTGTSPTFALSIICSISATAWSSSNRDCFPQFELLPVLSWDRARNHRPSGSFGSSTRYPIIRRVDRLQVTNRLPAPAVPPRPPLQKLC